MTLQLLLGITLLISSSGFASGTHRVQLMLLGDPGVGKSTLLYKYTNRMKDFREGATVGTDLLFFELNLGNQFYYGQIWDTAGQERYYSITQSYYKKAEAFILVYDVANETSFENLSRTWIDRVSEFDVPILIVANKMDTSEYNREVNEEKAQDFAKKHHASWVSASTKNEQGIVDFRKAIADLFQVCLDRRKAPIVVNQASPVIRLRQERRVDQPTESSSCCS